MTAAWCRSSISLGGTGGGFAAGLAVGLGLKRFPIFESGLAGDADATGAAVGDAPSFLRAWCFAGEAEASGLVGCAGEASAFFLRTFFEAKRMLRAGIGRNRALCPNQGNARKNNYRYKQSTFRSHETKLAACLDFRQR